MSQSPVNSFWEKKISFYFIDILDIDNDGKVNANDILSFKEMYRHMKGFDIDSAQYKSFSNFLDSWKNAITHNSPIDEITIEQFHAYCKNLREDLLKENKWPASSLMKEYVDALFAILDTNNDNLICKEDYLLNSANAEDYAARQTSWSLISKSDNFKIDKETFDKLCKEFLTSTNPEEPGNWIFGLFEYNK